MSRHIVIVGLGLIGGSMAKALRGFEDFDLIGVDVSEPTLRYALEQDVVDRVEPDPAKALAEGDLVFLCLHPQGILYTLAIFHCHCSFVVDSLKGYVKRRQNIIGFKFNSAAFIHNNTSHPKLICLFIITKP